MIERMKNGVYEFVQPDASVIGGIGAVMAIFENSASTETGVVVHAWGGAAAIMASYHAAFAAGGDMVEYPMLDFPLAEEMIGANARIVGGRLHRSDASGLGIALTPEMERKYSFDEKAVYSCALIDWGPPPDEYWKSN